MALTGIEIYKHLPKTNCKECGQPTCLAFAMKLAQKGIELSKCPHVSPEAAAALEAAAKPPMRLVTIGVGDKKLEVGNETVLFRHEKTFLNPTGIMVRVADNQPAAEVESLVAEVASYSLERVGMELRPNGFAVDNRSHNPSSFAQCVATIRAKSQLPLVLISQDPSALETALEKVGQERPLIYAADSHNSEGVIKLAKKYQCPLAIRAEDGLGQLAELSDLAAKAGVEDIVLDPGTRGFASSLEALTQIRRLALKKNFRPLGYPVITFPGEGAATPEEEVLLAGEHVAKYANIIVLDHFSPGHAYPLLTLRQNIYTDPQKPIQVSPGMYTIGSPRDNSPLLITTNFSLTYFSVAGEVEASGFPSWLLIADTEGLSVLTSWAAGKFDAEKIAKTVKGFNAQDSVRHRKLIIPGAVAVLRGELEDELSGWEIMVGPREAVDIGGFLKRVWAN
ncbi:MAG: acetyl-CoA decarbonylase/synthase complex subunit gamma [Chloroflexi bacterium]|nr:acetyl-CoA decarbonylase/synthase complex subunit gamma [Chloroflexota bacterium]